jgi:hypothetical protein
MRTSRLAGFVHKWLALLMAVQILFWFGSGLFFAIAPIEQVRSEHVKAQSPAALLSPPAVAQGLARLPPAGAERIELRSLMGRPVALLATGEGRPVLYGLDDGRLMSPLPPALAAAIAEADHAGPERAVRVTAVRVNTTEYRGPLPAWRVDFDDGAARALYVAADTGAVTARRSTLWRVYDFLWGLHIMDFSGHEDFNTPLLIAATALALVVLVSGIILFPSRLRLRRRKPLASEDA